MQIKKASGFFSKRLRQRLQRPHTVAPTPPEFLPLVLTAQRIGSQLASGGHRRGRSGVGQEFWQFRPANAQEPARHIDWRQSARGEELWVRERELDTSRTLAVWCDSAPTMMWRSTHHLPMKRTMAGLATLSLSAAALKGGEDVAVISYRSRPRSYKGLLALRSMAVQLRNETACICPRAQDIPRHSEILLVSDFLWSVDAISQAFQALESVMRRVNIICVLDPAEDHLPYRGHMQFLSPGDDLAHRADVDESFAQRYRVAMQTHLNHLRQHVIARGGSLTILKTSDDPTRVLQPLHARLARRAGSRRW